MILLLTDEFISSNLHVNPIILQPGVITLGGVVVDRALGLFVEITLIHRIYVIPFSIVIYIPIIFQFCWVHAGSVLRQKPECDCYRSFRSFCPTGKINSIYGRA